MTRFCPKCKGETERYADGRCKPCQNALSAAYRAANPKKVKAINASWRGANTETIKAYNAAYRAANIEQIRAKDAAYAKANRERWRVHGHNRRARLRGGKLSPNLAKTLFKLQRGKCACCGLPLGKNYHMDHIMPVALGGGNVDSNIQLLRQRCNTQKQAKHPVEFMQSRGFLL